jgi:transposase-like protein
VNAFCDEAGPPDPDQSLLSENERLRRENRILKEERELLKKATVGSTGQRNIFDLRCSERTYNATNRSPLELELVAVYRCHIRSP